MIDYGKLENRILTIIIHKTDKLKKKYPKISYDTEISEKEPFFPHIYIHELPYVEKNRTLEGNRIENILYTIQIEVSTNTNKSDCREVSESVNNIMKSLLFEVVSGLDFYQSGNVHRCVSRYRRNLSWNDDL